MNQRPTRRIKQALAKAPRQFGHQKPLGRLANRILDRGLNTSGDSDQPEHARPGRQRYVPSAWHVLPRALHYLGVSDRDTFVEFGCGKGRVSTKRQDGPSAELSVSRYPPPWRRSLAPVWRRGGVSTGAATSKSSLPT